MADGWFHTWPERSYDRLEGATPQGSPLHKAAVPLSSLLSHMSLAYSPITRGLHVLASAPDAQSRQDYPTEEAHESPIGNESSPKIKIDLTQSSEKDLVPQSCLKGKEKFERALDGEQRISKIGQAGGYVNVVSEEDRRATEVGSVSGGDGLEFLSEVEGLMQTEASSFSSIVSSLSDASPSQAEDSISNNLALDEDDRSQRSFDCSEQSKFFSENSPKVTKKKGFSNFFTKNVFIWKGSDSTSSPATWKFLSKTFSSSAPGPDSLSSQVSDTSLRGSSQSINDSGAQKYGDVVASSSALILHDRPASLPAKPEDEQVKHRQEYQDIVNAAKRKEEKYSKLRKKSFQRQLKHEEQLANAVRIWNCEILPKWNVMRNNRKTLDLWWSGLPPCVRGKVWMLAVDNELHITHHLYKICASRAEEILNGPVEPNGTLTNDCDQESSMELIQLDIARTFPQLCIFQKGGPYYNMLHSVLGAYVCYRPDVGYVQGMSFLAAILILNLEPADAFICFANILNKPCLHAFFTLSQNIVEAYYKTFGDMLKENLPRLHEHLTLTNLTPDLYLLDWVYSVFGKTVNLDVVCRIWDVFLRDGEEFIFRTALGILHLYESELLELDFVHGAQLLTRLPDSLSADLLFKSIASIKLTVGKQTFSQVLAKHTVR